MRRRSSKRKPPELPMPMVEYSATWFGFFMRCMSASETIEQREQEQELRSVEAALQMPPAITTPGLVGIS